MLRAAIRDCDAQIEAVNEKLDALWEQTQSPIDVFRERATREAQQKNDTLKELTAQRDGLEVRLSTLGERVQRAGVVARALLASGGLGALLQRLPYEGQKALAQAAAPSGIRVTRKGELLTPHAPAISQVFGPSVGVSGSAEPAKEVWWTRTAPVGTASCCGCGNSTPSVGRHEPDFVQGFARVSQ